MGVRLPPEYQETEWIEGNRNIQFIDSGIPGNINTLIIEAKVKPGAYVQYCPLWGNYASETQNVTRFISYGNNTILSYINTKSGGGTSTVSLTLFGTGKTFVIRQERTKLIVDGTEYAIPVNASGTENNKNVAINASKPDNPSTSNTSIQRWYYVRMFDGETKLRDFVPCYRKSDSKPGMYDLVSEEFFANAGTGEFVVGNDVIDSISPWLVARRRLLMRKPKLDTSPRIAQYGYGLSRSNTGITKAEANCYTKWYDVDPVATYQRTMTGSGVASGGANGYCFQTKMETGGNWDYWPNRRDLHANAISIRFTLITSEIDNAYVYCASGGQIFFAGKNTPYYGYTNINDMPTGT